MFISQICVTAKDREKLSTVLDIAKRYISHEEAAKLSLIEKTWCEQEMKIEETQLIGKESQLKMLNTSVTIV